MIGMLQRNKAFVIQFAGDVDIEAGKLEGRVEHVATSNWAHFHSLDELLAFLDRILAGIRATKRQLWCLEENEMDFESTLYEQHATTYMSLDSGNLKTVVRKGMLLMTCDEQRQFIRALESEMDRLGLTMRSYLVPLGISAFEAADLTANEVGHLIRYLRITAPKLMPSIERVLSDYSAFFGQPELPSALKAA
jgi:hypothetical protein